MTMKLKEYLNSCSVMELKEACRDNGIQGYSRLKKTELIEKIAQALCDPMFLYQCLRDMDAAIWPLFWETLTNEAPLQISDSNRIDRDRMKIILLAMETLPGLLICTQKTKNDVRIQYSEIVPEVRKALSLLDMTAMDALKKFQITLAQYANASVNLYGYLSFDDFQKLLKRYEPKITKEPNFVFFLNSFWNQSEIVAHWSKQGQHDFKAYDGKYVSSLPEFQDPETDKDENFILALSLLTRWTKQYYRISADGLFSTRFLADADQFLPIREDLQALIDSRKGKKQYYPARAEFLRYARIDYFEETASAKKCFEFLLNLIRNRPGKCDYEQDWQVFNEMALPEEFYQVTNDQEFEIQMAKAIRMKVQESFLCGNGPNDVLEELWDMLKTFHIKMKDNQMKTLIGLCTDMLNHQHCWENFGYSSEGYLSEMGDPGQKKIIELFKRICSGEMLNEQEKKLLMEGFLSLKSSGGLSSQNTGFSSDISKIVNLQSGTLSRKGSSSGRKKN